MMRLLWAASAVLLLGGCCGYSTRSLLPSHLRSLAVQPADNTTAQPGLGEELTDALVTAFNSDRTLRVTSVENANLVVTATVDDYSRAAASYTGEQVISAYEIVVSARVQAQDQVRDEEFFSGTVSAKTTYDPDPNHPNYKTEDQAAQEAITRLAGEVVRQILTAW